MFSFVSILNHVYEGRNTIMRYILAMISALLMTGIAEAQISFNLSFNVDHQPMWGPTGYDYVEYYYLPDIEVYYYVPERRFYYYEGGIWISGGSLPYRYRNYNLYNSYKVVVNDRTPYHNHVTYRERYSSYKGKRDQSSIRDSRDTKYFGNKNHPEHRNWVKQQKNDNGHGKEKGRDNKRGRK